MRKVKAGKGLQILDDEHSPLCESSSVKPPKAKWYQFFERKRQKKLLIAKHLDDYREPLKEHQPSEKDLKDYEKKLKGLTLSELESLNTLREYKLKLDFTDRLKSINKKKFAVVTIFNDNKTTDTGVCHSYSRTFSRDKMRYIVMSERGIYDPEFSMQHFYYYANQPFPILFRKGELPEGQPDGKLLDSTIEMSVLEALANINMKATMNLVLVLVIFILILTAVNTFINVKAAGII